jgi:hypothetical protein
MTQDRRRFLTLAAAFPFAALAAGRALADAPLCYDPEALPMSQRGLRKALQFIATSTDPAKRCDLCAFYKAGLPGCGSCQILNGPVAAGSLCSSFAPRAKG